MSNMEEKKLGGKILDRKNKGWCKNNEVTTKIITQKCEHVKV
jgi:hypothetical protein